MKTTWLFIFILIGVALGAQNLTIMTEEDPPYNFTGPDGKLQGFAVDVVTEIQMRVGTDFPISVYPWARAYDTLLRTKNCVLFTMARTVQREDLFQWVGPITENRWVVVGLATFAPTITSLDDLRDLDSIGVVRSFASAQYLTELKFTNLEDVTQNEMNVLKLLHHRIDVYVSSDNTWRKEIVDAKQDPALFKELYTLKSAQLYIAHSKTTAPEVVARWQKAFDEMRADGTLLKLIQKWLPGRGLPGPAATRK